MSFPVSFQDITTMTALRRDGHPSVYNKFVSQTGKQHLGDYKSDCSHWCLPGVPDTWNEMLSVMLQLVRRNSDIAQEVIVEMAYVQC